MVLNSAKRVHPKIYSNTQLPKQFHSVQEVWFRVSYIYPLKQRIIWGEKYVAFPFDFMALCCQDPGSYWNWWWTPSTTCPSSQVETGTGSPWLSPIPAFYYHGFDAESFSIAATNLISARLGWVVYWWKKCCRVVQVPTTDHMRLLFLLQLPTFAVISLRGSVLFPKPSLPSLIQHAHWISTSMHVMSLVLAIVNVLGYSYSMSLDQD